MSTRGAVSQGRSSITHSTKAKSRKPEQARKGFGKNQQPSIANFKGIKKRFQNVIGKQKETLDAIDPITKQIKNPLPLYNVHQNQYGSIEASASFTSGNISPSSMSEISEFDRASSFSFGKETVQTGSLSQADSSASSIISDEESFVFSGPVTIDDMMSQTGSVDLSFAVGQELKGSIDIPTSDNFIKKQENDTGRKVQNEQPQLTPKQQELLMEMDFTITLVETETFFLFDKFDESVKMDDPKIEEVRERNRRYRELLKNKENNSDNFVNKDVQTLNTFKKNKRTTTSKPEVQSVEVSVTEYQIYDDRKEIEEMEEREREERELISSLSNKQEEEEEEEAFENDEIDTQDDNTSTRSGGRGTEKVTVPPYQELVMTRAIVQNIFHEQQQMYKLLDLKDTIKESESKEIIDEYRSTSSLSVKEHHEEEKTEMEDIEDLSEDEEEVVIKKQGKLTSLWEYKCDFNETNNVNCMTWNKENKDILAVGYGNGNVTENNNNCGYIVCWTLKNPSLPERIYRIQNAGVNSLNFSSSNPSILAAGLDDGTVAIYDVRRKENSPVMETSKSHTGTVWDLRWVDRGKDLGERLHSVGVDGRVNVWTIKKGLESSEIMRLKRSRSVEFGSDALISRESGGMSIDFSPVDSNIYLVGTEDGTISKCSCSYTEQPLETYHDHTGPVYSVRWNPYVPDVFVSCSADWTVKIWNQEQSSPIFAIESYSDKSDQRSYAVTDVAWSKYCSTMFSTTSIVGNLEIWDLSFSTVRPKFSKNKLGTKLNCTLFAEDVPIVLVGDNTGCVEVLRAEGVEQNNDTDILASSNTPKSTELY
ncbi:hypothetical protein ABK040_001851 [Willaertia magna]